MNLPGSAVGNRRWRCTEQLLSPLNPGRWRALNAALNRTL